MLTINKNTFIIKPLIEWGWHKPPPYESERVHIRSACRQVLVTIFLSCVRVRGERTSETSPPSDVIFFLVVVTHQRGMASISSSYVNKLLGYHTLSNRNAFCVSFSDLVFISSLLIGRTTYCSTLLLAFLFFGITWTVIIYSFSITRLFPRKKQLLLLLLLTNHLPAYLLLQKLS